MAPPTAVFVRRASFSHINDSVVAQLRERLPEFALRDLDVRQELLRPRLDLRLLGWAAVWAEYGGRIARGDFQPGELFYRTVFMARTLEALTARALVRLRPAWTFQTSSLFYGGAPGIPHFVYTDHTHLANRQYPAFDRRKLARRAWIAYERSIFHRAARVFTMSGHVSRSLADDYGLAAERIECVRAGSNVDRSLVQPVPGRHASGRIVFVGVDWERKGGPELAAAFAAVRASHPTATLTIIGCQPALNQPGVTVAGRLPLAEVAGHYNTSAIVCVPTRVEPFGIVFVEAQEFGLPVVSRRIGALPEIVRDGETGLLTDGSAAEIATALGRLLAAPTVAEAMGQAGLDHARRSYRWDHTGELLSAAVRTTLKNPVSDDFLTARGLGL